MNNLDDLNPGQLADLQAQISAKLGASAPILRPRSPRRRKNSRIQYLTETETAALFRALKAGGSARDLAIFEIAYHRGLRASEVGMLKLAHLRPDLKRISIERLKGSHGGEYLLTDREQNALRAWLRVRGKDPGTLFPSRHRRPISRRRLDELMKSYGATAELPPDKRHFHCLKHSCATALLEAEVAIEVVQDHLGHANIQSTMQYAKVTNARRARLGQEMQRKW
jgi:site-specific recombinase XerD